MTSWRPAGPRRWPRLDRARFPGREAVFDAFGAEASGFALDRLGIRPAEAVFVGDALADLEMARATGTPFVAVGGTTDPAVFTASGAGTIWSGVGAWVDALLAPEARPR
jgi:hypothetical protein